MNKYLVIFCDNKSMTIDAETYYVDDQKLIHFLIDRECVATINLQEMFYIKKEENTEKCSSFTFDFAGCSNTGPRPFVEDLA